MVDDRELIRRTLRALSRRLRLVRGISAGARFLVAGLVLALVPLLLKGLFPIAGPIAAAVVVGLAALGFLYGVLARLPQAHTARLADRHLHLKERLTSAREHLGTEPSGLADPADMVRAQLADTAARLREVGTKGAFPVRLPREARWVPPVAALVLALVLLPPVPFRLPATEDDSSGQEATPAEEQQAREKPLEQKLAPPALPDQLFPKTQERQAQAGPLSTREQTGDLNAVYQDTRMSQQRPDFGSFIKQGDERLKLLARPDSIPDLSRDFTQSPYQVMIRRMQEQVKSGRLQGLTWEQIERLLSEMGQSMQRYGSGSLPDDLMSELQREGGGSRDKMLDALSRALNRLRERDEAGRGKGGNLRDARDGERGSGQGRGEGDQGKGEDGSTGGSLPGTGKSLQTRADPTARIGGEKQEANLEGDLREGQMEAYETNLSGPGTQNPSRLQYMEVFSRYQKMMEEALAKEAIPFNYREQVKEYFRSLENR